MNQGLARLIRDYQTAVRQAVALIVSSGISLPASNDDWVAANIPGKGTLKEGVPYFKHGYGCAVALPSGTVDFDFGAEGQTDGFDDWRLAQFAKDRLDQYGFTSQAEFKAAFQQAIDDGVLTYSGYILYYVLKA